MGEWTMNTVKIDKYFRGMIAHRGLSGIETENTLPAFIAAANRSYFGIECDVHASKDGKIIVTHDDLVEVPAEAVDSVLDTTGAGDLFAAGFLFGYTRGRPLAECGRLGSVAAAEVISHVGPRPLVELRRLID